MQVDMEATERLQITFYLMYIFFKYVIYYLMNVAVTSVDDYIITDTFVYYFISLSFTFFIFLRFLY